ncbi:MAG: glycosyltransferase family 39 protein, partial [Myxococcota bacterium]
AASSPSDSGGREEPDEEDLEGEARGAPWLFGLVERFDARTTQVWRDRAAIACAAAAVMIPFLWGFGLWDPWETHYGEVGRQITERNDWISTWWGSHWEDAGGAKEGSYFFSKPILLMWMMAMGMTAFGVNEFGVRIGVCLVAMLTLVLVYSAGRSVYSRRVGWLMAATLGTSPFFVMLSRQAQTDMPFVGLMTVGMCFFLMGVFGKDRDEPADAATWGMALGWTGLMVAPQVVLLLAGLSRWRGGKTLVLEALGGNTSQVAVIGGGVLLAVGCVMTLAALWVGRDGGVGAVRKRRRLAWGALAVTWLPLAAALVALMVTGAGAKGAVRNLNGWFVWGPTQAMLYATAAGAAIYWTLAAPDVRKRRVNLLMFYVFIALATLAKGLLGFMLPGAILFFYILLTREWRLLREVELPRGLLVFVAVSFPWYAAMLTRHTVAFWNRFFVHDHFKRLATGVHQVDEGSFEHFARWLIYGCFPWSAFAPVAAARLVTDRSALAEEGDKSRATLMIVLWGVIAFTLFTLSSTKFHHYVFPVVPALTMLVALALDDAMEQEMPRPLGLWIVAIGLMGVVAWDMMDDPQVLKNLFTYKYDRGWDDASWDRTFCVVTGGVAAASMAGASLMLMRNRAVRACGLGVLVAASLGMSVYALHVYMPQYSSAWSQAKLWEAYYAQCDEVRAPPKSDVRKTYCRQPIIAYKLNWRGENFYSHNLSIPIRDDDDFTHFLSQQKGETFYGVMEMARFKGEFARKLPQELRGKACITYSGNLKFLLAKIPCAPDDPMRIDEQALRRELDERKTGRKRP